MTSALFEKTLEQLGSITSNLTGKHKAIRMKNDYEISFVRAQYNSILNYLSLQFVANSTFGAGVSSAPKQRGAKNARPNQYTQEIRFYGVRPMLGDLKSKDNRKRVEALNKIMGQCDVKFYSTDPSWYFQGDWEEAAKDGTSIYKFPGPKGKGIWKARHQNSGGLSDGTYINKHMSQLIDELPSFFPVIAKSVGGIFTAKTTEPQSNKNLPTNQAQRQFVADEVKNDESPSAVGDPNDVEVDVVQAEAKPAEHVAAEPSAQASAAPSLPEESAPQPPSSDTPPQPDDEASPETPSPEEEPTDRETEDELLESRLRLGTLLD
jgi:hypothetical protein